MKLARRLREEPSNGEPQRGPPGVVARHDEFEEPPRRNNEIIQRAIPTPLRRTIPFM